MKVYEIISMNEAVPMLGLLGKGAELLGKGLEKVKNPIKAFRGAEGALKDAIAKEIGDIARVQNIDIKDAAKAYSARLERKIGDEMMNIQRRERALGRPMPDINSPQLRAKAMENLEIDARQLDKNFVKDASTSAQLTRGAEALGLADVSGWRLAGNAVKLGLNGYGFYTGFYQPWSQFSDTMTKYAAMVPDKLSEKEYNFLLNQELTKLVSAWGTQLVVGGFYKGVVNKLTPGEKKMGMLLHKENPKFDLLTDAGLQVVRTWLNSGDNSGALSALLLTDILGTEQPLAQFIGRLLAPFLGKLKSFTGIGPAASGADAKAANAGSTGSGGKPVGGGGSGNSQVASTSPAAPAATSTAAGGGTLSRSYFANDPDMGNWEIDPGDPSRIRDPNNPANSVYKPPGWKPAK